MERLIKEKVIGDTLTIDADYSAKPFKIVDLEVFLIKSRNAGATHIKIEGDVNEYSLDSISIVFIELVEEADAEFIARKAEEMERIEYNKRHSEFVEKAKLAELKLKYPNL